MNILFPFVYTFIDPYVTFVQHDFRIIVRTEYPEHVGRIIKDSNDEELIFEQILLDSKNTI